MSDMWYPPEQDQGYTTDPYQTNALLDYLLSLSKGDLAQNRSALTGVGTDLSNQAKVLGIQNKMYDNTGDLMKLAMNPGVGQMSGAFDPMALQQQQMQMDPSQQIPFGATDYSPIRQQWQTSNTPAAQAVLAMFDQIDQGQDPTTLVQQFAQKTGGSLDIPDQTTGLTGKQLLNYGSAYWNEATKRQAAQAQFQYQQAGQPPQQIPGMEGVDPTLGSFTEPFVQPSIGETLVGNEMDRQMAPQMQRDAMFRSLAGTQASGPVSGMGDLRPPAVTAHMPQNDGRGGIPGLGNAISGFFQMGMRGGNSDTTPSRSSGRGPGVSGALGAAGRAVSSASKARPKSPPPRRATQEEVASSNDYVKGRLSGLEDKERARLGLKPRSTGQSVGQHNLDARLRYLGGQPYPG